MPAPIISLKKASVIYDPGTPIEYKALDNVSISIYPEEYIIFYGPSGCGKSTLLYTISGLLALTDGEVSVLGKDLTKLSRAEMVEYHRRSVGMVFQAYYLIPSLSVRANVALPQIFLKLPKQKRIENTEKILARFGIVEQKGKLPTQLSGGQQQRVAVSRALINDPPILLADEPVGNLDSKSAESVLELLRQLNEQDKKTVILVTHNPEHLHFAHRVFYMQDGKVLREVKNQRAQVREEELKPLKSHGLTEIARLFPNLSEDALKAKMLALYLLDEQDPILEDRIEQVVQGFIKGSLNKETLINHLSQPMREGGIGLYQSYVNELAEELVGIVGVAQYLRTNFGTFPRNYKDYEGILDTVVRYLTLISKVHLTKEQTERLKRALKGRLEGSLDKSAFEAVLDKSLTDGGIGFNLRTAKNLTRRLELLLLEYPVEIIKFKSEKNGHKGPLKDAARRIYPGSLIQERLLKTLELKGPAEPSGRTFSQVAPMIFPKSNSEKGRIPRAPQYAKYSRSIESAPLYIEKQ